MSQVDSKPLPMAFLLALLDAEVEPVPQGIVEPLPSGCDDEPELRQSA